MDKEKDVCCEEGKMVRETPDLDKRVNCKQCPKCGGKGIAVMYDEKHCGEKKGWIEECLTKYCDCGYGWTEDCLDKKSGK